MSVYVSVALLLSACGAGSQPDTMASAAGSSDTTANAGGTVDSSIVTEPERSEATGQAAGVDTAFTTTTGRPSVDLTSSSVSSILDGQQDPVAEPFWDVEVLGVSMVGTGEYVRLTEPDASTGAAVDESEGEDEECKLGWLGYLVGGQVHRYEELGPIGHPRLFNGLRGQDAIVVSCEESTEQVLIQGSAVLPADGVPQFTSFELGSPHYMGFAADFGWRGDLFGGYAWRDGFDELVYFDTGTNAIVEAASLAGTRVEQLDHGFDIVMPNGWEVLTYEAAAVTIAIAPPDAGSYISVLSVPLSGDPEFPEGAELQDFWTDDVPLWDYVSTDRGTIIGSQTRFNWRLNYEGGTLVVQHLEAGDHDLIIQYFVAAGEDHLWDLAQAATDQIRHYQYATVG